MQPTDTSAVVEALRLHDRFMVTSHDNPDGDALGSLLATHLALEVLGKDSVMVLGGIAPLPGEYAFLDLDGRGLLRRAPPDLAERVLVAVDCAQESRIVEPTLVDEAALTVNVDHHHDNTRFGDVDLVVEDASSTGEVLADVLAALGVGLTPAIAEALYTAVVTDTGRFQYSNTTPKAGSSSPSSGARTSTRQVRRSRTPRGSSTTCARSTEPSWSRSSGSFPKAPRPRARDRSAPTPMGSTCRRSPAASGAGGTSAPQGSRPT